MDFGWYGERDVSAAVDWLRQRADVRPDRIAVLGLSMGGEEAIGAAGADGRIRAVVAEGATGRTAADKAGWLPHGVLGSIQRGLDRVTFGLAGVLSGAPEPVTLTSSARRASPRPILLIVAGNVPDESRAAATIQAGSPSNVRIWVAANAGHVVGLATDPGGWERTVVTFLTASLELS
jgi:dienelactone hydrolase